MRRAIEKYISSFGLEIVGTAGDGEQALEIFKQYTPDIVTMDITMPKMDGLVCLEKIMGINPDCRVLVISALKDPSTGLKALKLGAKGFLPKPFTQNQLQEEFEALLEGDE